MDKGTKFWRNPWLWTAGILLVIVLTPAALVRLPAIQQYLLLRLTSMASQQLGTRVEIGSLHISLLFDVVCKDLVIYDHRDDTAIYTPRIRMDLGGVHLKRRHLTIDKVTLREPRVNLVRYEIDSLTNISQILKRLKPLEPDTGRSWSVTTLSVGIIDGAFVYRNEHEVPKPSGMDYDHVRIDSVFLDAALLQMQDDTIDVMIYHAAMRAEPGFALDSLQTRFLLWDQGIEARHLIMTSGESRLDLDLAFHFNIWKDFRNFLDEVQIHANIRKSRLNLSDIGPFAAVVYPMNNLFEISGLARGTVRNFSVKNMQVIYGQGTYLAGDVSMNGIPDIYETFVDARINRLTFSASDVQNFKMPRPELALKLPDMVNRLNGSIIAGNFSGFYNDFIFKAEARTPFGSMLTDLVLRDQTTGDIAYTYQGQIRATSFRLGQLLASEETIGSITADLRVNGRGLDWETLDANVTGRIDSIVFMGEGYQAFEIDGHLKGKRFNGFLSVDDPDLALDFNGIVDLSGDMPSFDFLADVYHARLDKLSRGRLPGPLTGKSGIAMQFQGDHLDRLRGRLELTGLDLDMGTRHYHCNSFELGFVPDAYRYKEVVLHADPLDLEMKGSFTFQDLANSLISQLASLMPSSGLRPAAKTIPADQFATLRMEVTDLNPLLQLFLPELSIPPGTHLVASIRTTPALLEWEATSANIKYQGIEADSLVWTGKVNSASGTTSLATRALSMTDSIEIYRFNLQAGLQQDSIPFTMGWMSAQDVTDRDGHITGLIDFPGLARARLRLLESKIPMDNNLWSFNPQHSMIIDSTGILFQDVRLQNREQLVRLTGKASKEAGQSLEAQFNNFDIHLINIFLQRYMLDLAGKIDGDVSFTSVLSKPDFRAALTIRDFIFNGDKLGDANLRTTWDPMSQRLFIDSKVTYRGTADTHVPLEITGFYLPGEEEAALDLTAKVKDFKISTVERYMQGLFSNMGGYVSGEVRLRGPLKNLRLNGKAISRRTGFTVNYLNEAYSFSHEILIDENAFRFKDLTLFDARGNSAICNGSISHTRFKDWRIDFEAKPVNFSGLNTTYAQNELFYGRGFLTGDVLINGPFDDVNIQIKGETGKGTSMHIPISYDADVIENSFIRFHQPAGTREPEAMSRNRLSGVKLDFQLAATQDAEIEISLPARMGNIRGNGTGDLRFLIDTRGEFSIFGDYIVESGFYQMTLQNLLNRRFELRKGGRISWSGDPYDASIALTAVYRVRASLNELRPVGDSSSLYRERIPVNCIINLTDKLINPMITFGIELPDSREEVNRLVFNRIDTTNTALLSRQILSLLVLNSFISEEVNVNLASGVSAGSVELLTRQLSNWLSQISKDFDIGVNYRPGDQITNEELELALSTQLFNDRVLIDGNFGLAGERKAEAASNLVGDVQVEVKLTEDGRFRVKAFNRSNYINMLDNKGPYTQGVGIFYRKEFDRWDEILPKRNKRKDPSEI